MQRGARKEIPRAYDHKAVEEPIYKLWLDGGYFAPKEDPDRQPFVIIMPLPNVTGELHLGHALMAALEDLMTRWHRMLGEPCLWLPGTDHAGIATQVVVERELAKEGLTRQQLGREKFLERVWEWVGKYGGIIGEQFHRLGVSCDWSRDQFTLDQGPSRAVRTTFVNLYRKGLIYRGERIINWCPRCATALSDLEVEHQEEQGNLFYIRYPLEGGDGAITVATTRPETMLGDTAVAVNPGDARYKGLVGKTVLLPIMERPIPVIADEAVGVEFGTGALKVTPGHDPVDFELGQRHGLPLVNVMNLDGTMNENAGRYQGIERFEVRRRIVEELESQGLLEKLEPYKHSVGHCQRCDSIAEPLVSKQWFVKMSPSEGIARAAIEAVTSGKVRIIPERFIKVYLNWMENIRDWCISRQLWWGHRIPVWYCDACGEVTVDDVDPSACASCGSPEVHQDPDVLDTWFSSALWTHSTLGWPDDTEDMRRFYPGSVMETGYDILFFWVARMIMMGLENAGDIPFHTVYLHGLIRDVEGAKMSKTRGNVLDPLAIIDQYGADALRFALTTGTSPGNDQRMNTSKLEASRNFVNKLWNAARFVMGNLGQDQGVADWVAPRPIHRQDRWILSRLNRVSSQVGRLMEQFQFGEAQRLLYDFAWGEYCDWYIEMAKLRLRSDDQEGPLPVLVHVLEKTLRLLHPFMPFVTEELWQGLKGELPNGGDLPEALIIASYPQSDQSLVDPQAERDMEQIIAIVRAIRNLRAELRIEAAKPVDAVLDAPGIGSWVGEEEPTIRALANADPLTLASDGSPSPSHGTVTAVLREASVTLRLHGLVDLDKERSRLEKEMGEAQANIDRIRTNLDRGDFLKQAPEDVVERERERLVTLEERHARIEQVLSRLSG